MKLPRLLHAHDPLPSHGWRSYLHMPARHRGTPDPLAKRDSAAGYSFDDSRHPIWAIANSVAVFFLIAVMVSFVVLMTDAFLSHT